MQPLHLAAGDVCNIAPPPSGMLCVAARLEVAQALFKAGVDAKAVDLQQCDTPMHLACTCGEGNVEMVKLLLKHGAGAIAEDKALATPISSAVVSKYYPEVWKVLEPIVQAHGVQVLSMRASKAVPLALAVLHWRLDAVRELLRLGAPVNLRPGSMQDTALLIACEYTDADSPYSREYIAVAMEVHGGGSPESISKEF